ncbi:hypothetical protein GYMLUDRAFT_62957 [Collybiopsis luxurians FD-317 M1]|uniref:Uncharacterized protein n=1 Tax=Collybiopsis luxurians FD-317 M1 TaxID=944289 RepID=A0A0D0BY30_9AGAR|nr:hypothetical protein GYMLUDRAFT_62957 [Collybiopsis luxurians FD-317 M1]
MIGTIVTHSEAATQTTSSAWDGNFEDQAVQRIPPNNEPPKTEEKKYIRNDSRVSDTVARLYCARDHSHRERPEKQHLLFCDKKFVYSARDDLQDEPECLAKDYGSGQCITLPPVFDLFFADSMHDELKMVFKIVFIKSDQTVVRISSYKAAHNEEERMG